MVHIYYGFGKGKTSTLNGGALRAKGAGLKPFVFRFLKGRHTSEDKVLIKVGIPVISLHPSTKFVIQMTPSEAKEAKLAALKTFQEAKERQKTHNFILLDEILDIVYLGFISENTLIEFVKNVPPNVEVLMSGHYKFDKLFQVVDLITHYVAEKHYFNTEKVQARLGVEF